MAGVQTRAIPFVYMPSFLCKIAVILAHGQLMFAHLGFGLMTLWVEISSTQWPGIPVTKNFKVLTAGVTGFLVFVAGNLGQVLWVRPCRPAGCPSSAGWGKTPNCGGDISGSATASSQQRCSSPPPPFISRMQCGDPLVFAHAAAAAESSLNARRRNCRRRAFSPPLRLVYRRLGALWIPGCQFGIVTRLS